MPDSESVESALRGVKYPGFSRDIVSFGIVKGIEVEGGAVKVSLAVTTNQPEVPRELQQNAEAAVRALPGVESVEVTVRVSQPKGQPGAGQGGEGNLAGSVEQALQKVRFAIAVASGKGGVGKSTFSVNLACAIDLELAERGGSKGVGIMDCDIYGPSIPLMMGISGRPELEDDMIVPLENFGVRVMSMGLLIDADSPVVWRGPMVMKTIQQFAMNVNWGELDVLVVDLPPGTGDAQLSLVQTIPLDGAVIVTTPQAAAVNVARRGATMFGKVSVPLLGVAENMSYLEDPATGKRQYLFGEGGGAQAAHDLEAEFLGQIPLDGVIREGGDNGIPVVLSHPDSLPAKAFRGMARRLIDKLEQSRSNT